MITAAKGVRVQKLRAKELGAVEVRVGRRVGEPKEIQSRLSDACRVRKNQRGLSQESSSFIRYKQTCYWLGAFHVIGADS